MKPLIKNKLFYLNEDYSKVAYQNTLSSLSETNGIYEFEFKEPGRLKVVFNLMTIRAEEIESLVKESGILLSERFFDRFRRDWRHYLEKNEYDNIIIEPHSCCKPPR